MKARTWKVTINKCDKPDFVHTSTSSRATCAVNRAIIEYVSRCNKTLYSQRFTKLIIMVERLEQ